MIFFLLQNIGVDDPINDNLDYIRPRSDLGDDDDDDDGYGDEYDESYDDEDERDYGYDDQVYVGGGSQGNCSWACWWLLLLHAMKDVFYFLFDNTSSCYILDHIDLYHGLLLINNYDTYIILSLHIWIS